MNDDYIIRALPKANKTYGVVMKTIFASALLCCSLAVYAEGETDIENMPIDNLESDVGKFNIVLAAAVTFGGDKLTALSTDYDVSAGGMLYLAGGGVYHVSTSMDVQATVGVHVDAAENDTGSFEFTRTFFELMPFYIMDSGSRVGVGVTHVVSPEFTAPSGTIKFDDTNGIVVEYDWMLARHYFLGVRYADLSYKSTYGLISMPNGDVTDTVDGNYFGVIIQGHF